MQSILQLKRVCAERYVLAAELHQPPRSGEGSLRGLESRARCAGFSVMEIGNRKERLRVREAGASAAGRGQRPYASFPDRQPYRFPPVTPIKKQESRSEAKPDSD